MPSDPQRIQTVFLAAAEIHDPAERARFLDGACDAELKSRVEALLHAHDQPDSLLDHPADALHDPDTGGTRTFGHEGGAPADGDEAPLPFLEPSSRPDSLGRIGHYEILQILGRGGFGIVFRAFDEVLQRVVALKVLAPAIAATSPARKRFLREARSSAQVRHENVVQVHAVEEQPLPYLVMEFIPGETLQQRLDRVGPLEAPEIVRIGRQIAEGLAAAHATDLIHRDIKPANVLLEGGHQRVKITDFGLARAADDASLSQSGVLAGTPMYMAPEQAKGEKIDCRADLFSLGSVLYVMCSGRPPFRASSTFAVLKRVVDDAPRPIREVIPETPQWLCDIIAKLHAKKPEDRFQSAREVADVFADCEVQLKANAKVQDFSRIPQRKPAAGAGGRWKWIAAAALLLPVLALATTEMAGITHLFGAAGRQQPTPDRPKNGGEVPGTPLVPATANDLPLVSGGPTDLIPFARPDLSSGRWESHDGKLVHPARDSQGYPGLTLAVRGPDDFDLEAEFERTSGDDFIAFGMSSRGHLFCVALDTWGQWAGLQAVAGELSNANPTRRMGPWLTTGRRHTFRCEVRASGVRAWLDAREVVDYRGGYEDLAFGRPGLPDWAQFFVQANDNCGFVVHKLVLTPFPPAPEYTNSLGMKFELIPAGKFTMGSSQEEIDRCLLMQFGDGMSWAKKSVRTEGPEHPVEITRPFYLGATNVTVGQFRQFVDEAGYQVGDGRWRNPGFDQTDQHPVVFVSWNNAVDFCNWLSKKEGKAYRLPTEAEWEYSCRAGKAGSRYCFGDDEAQLEDYAWYNKNSGGGTHPVGKKKPNDWGLYDMHGNAWGWCQDNYDPNYYKTSPPKDPPGPSAGGGRVARGGSWPFPPVYSRSAFRGYLPPDMRFNCGGFRVLLVSPPGGVQPESGAKDKPAPPAVAPFTDADVQRIAALPAAEQVEEVRKELMRRNPGFDGQVDHRIKDGVVTEIRVVTDQVTDISPLRVFNALRVLDCSGTHTPNWRGNGQLADLTPLKGMNVAGLTQLHLSWTKVGDEGMSLFKDCKNLTQLDLSGTQVTDASMAHFKDCKNLSILYLGLTQVTDAGLAHFKDFRNLTVLFVNDTQVTDSGLAYFKECMNLRELLLDDTTVTDAGLAHFKDCKDLTHLGIARTKVTDLSLLKGMPLKELTCDFQPERDAEILRSIKTLETINDKPAEEFWKSVEKK